LIAIALDNNRDLAMLRIREARAIHCIQRVAGFPQLVSARKGRAVEILSI